jgi:DNA recombination protein RmuC
MTDKETDISLSVVPGILVRQIYIAVDGCSLFVHDAVGGRRINMSAGIPELLLLSIGTASASIAAVFAILCFFRTRTPVAALTKETAAPLLRSETEIIRTALQDQARWLRQELGQSLTTFQEMMLTTFGTMRDGIDGQVRGFGERLDAGVKAIDERAAGIATKVNDDIAQMRSEANSNREHLRAIVEQKLDQNISVQAEASKVLRDELGGNFQRLGSRVSESLIEASQIQKERLENVTGALTGLSDRLEKALENVRATLESSLAAIRQENAVKLDEMRQTVDERLQSTLETRLGESFNRVVEHLERVHKGIGEMQSLAANVGDLKNVLTNVKVRGTYGRSSSRCCSNSSSHPTSS